MKCVIVLAILLLSDSLASATGDKETDVSQLRALTEKQRFIPTSMTRYSAVPRASEKIDEVVPLIGEVVAGRHKIGLSRDDGGCFAYPLVEPIVRHTDLHVIPYEIAYEKETTVHVPLQVTLKGATIGFDRGTKFFVRSPMVFDFEFHKNPRYLISIIQYYTDEEDIVAKAEDLLLVHEVIVSDIVKQADFRFEIMLHSHGSGGFAHSDFEHLGLILGFKVVSLREIAASKDDIEYKIIEQGTFGATIRFKSALNDPDVILVDRTHGADTVIERSTIRVNQNSNPLIDAYFVTANLVYYGSFDLSVGDDLSISNAAPPTIVALRWVEEESRDILRQCQTEE